MPASSRPTERFANTRAESDTRSRCRRRLSNDIALRAIAGPPHATRPGTRFPPGATPAPDGVNFCVFSRYATHVELLLFADAASTAPFQTVTLTPEQNRSFFFWHVFVEGLAPGVCYAWRVH